MGAVDRERLARRRELWQRVRETGELPPDPVANAVAERRRRRRYWWVDLDEEGALGPPETPRPAGEQRAGCGAVRWTSETLYQLGAVAA